MESKPRNINPYFHKVGSLKDLRQFSRGKFGLEIIDGRGFSRTFFTGDGKNYTFVSQRPPYSDESSIDVWSIDDDYISYHVDNRLLGMVFDRDHIENGQFVLGERDWEEARDLMRQNKTWRLN